MTDFKKQGKLNRARGARFELKTRADLEEKGWIVDKWSNQVELGKNEGCGKVIGKYVIGDYEDEDNIYCSKENICEECKNNNKGKLIRTKGKWAGPGRPMSIGTGFPDFIALRDSCERYKGCKEIPLECLESCKKNHGKAYEVIGVECKVGKYLDKAEKEKCNWLLKNNVFSKILISYPEKQGRKIVVKYKEYK